MPEIEIVPAILRKTYEKIEIDWNQVHEAVNHIQLDITDGVFAGDGTFRDIPRFKQLKNSEKAELHMMVHKPAYYVDDIINLNPARCVFHLEAFSGTADLALVYAKLKSATQAELALAINPDTPTKYLEENLPLVDYVLFMGYNPGWANQPINPTVYRKIAAFAERHSYTPIAVDGAVNKQTVPFYAKAGATILCANSSVFSIGDPVENITQLKLLAEAAID